MNTKLMKGNEALAEGAVRAGCRFFSGYPITPQSEILEYLSRRMPEVGGTFIQSESELAGMGMLHGAAATGTRVLSSSAGPGFSLLHEELSYMAAQELPAVVVVVQRYGPGLGDIFQGQSDYFQITRGGGHGDYRLISLAPDSVQGCADIMPLAFELAEKHRHPVLVVSDAALSQMMESVDLPPAQEHNPDSIEWACKGRSHAPRKAFCNRMYADPDWDSYIQKKYRDAAANEQRWESFMTDDAECVFVAYGISSRLCKEAVHLARAGGLKLGLLRPITLWPFPKEGFAPLLMPASPCKIFMTLELSALPQIKEDVELAIAMRKPVHAHTPGRHIPTPEQLVKAARVALQQISGGTSHA